MTGCKTNTPPPTTGHTVSAESINRFIEEASSEAQESEDFTPVEYKVELIHDLKRDKGGQLHNPSDNLEEALNEFGAAGWELAVWNRMDGYAIFKRC